MSLNLIKDDIKNLIDEIVKTKNYSSIKGRVYELKVLKKELIKLEGKKFKISIAGINSNNSNNVKLYFPAPASEKDKSDFNYFIAERNKAKNKLQVWISPKVIVRSALEKYNSKETLEYSDLYELDVGIFKYDPKNNKHTSYFLYDELDTGISCKNVGKFKKGFVREILGMKLETIIAAKSRSYALYKNEFFLYSADPNCVKYNRNLKFYNVEIKHFPY